MNPFISEKIIQALKNAGYDVRPELGDRVITAENDRHIIYIQVREGKKTYIPVTLTQPIADITTPEITPSPQELHRDVDLSQPVDDSKSVSGDASLLTRSVLNIQDPQSLTHKNINISQDEHIKSLLEKVNTTRQKIRSITH